MTDKRQDLLNMLRDLRVLKRVVRVPDDYAKPIRVCGEMGRDETLIPFLRH